MTAYAAIALVFVGISAVTAAILTLRAGRQRAHFGAVAAATLILFALTAAFDNLMIAAGLFHYDPDLLLGVRWGLAPVEDFTYPLAGVLLLPSLWALLRGRRARSERGER